jgi:hypothetical protein
MIIGNDGGAINMTEALKPSLSFSPWIDKKGWVHSKMESTMFHFILRRVLNFDLFESKTLKS